MTTKKQRVLVTGATGNIGVEVIRNLIPYGDDIEIIAGVRDIEKAKHTLSEFPEISFTTFDFEDNSTFASAFDAVDLVFLLRPPHISNIEQYFVPLINQMEASGISRVVFLSVQGAEKSNIIPHRKIEKVILNSSLEYIFVRPSYFMQNLTTTLLPDIKHENKIILPAGKARFNWVDGKDVGEASALLLVHFEIYKNNAFDITGEENLNFDEAVQVVNEQAGTNIVYESTNPLRFYQIKRKQDINKGKVFVMIFLHFLPRFQKEPRISSFFHQLTGKKPRLLKEFVIREKETFQKY